ncbi:hypothetical protein NMY22_g14887 [Coprinellus aureogranulatus]|nr:hypothetical protein NMY22_g14887 [Coprinellus aureogranulatus]
MDCPSSPPPAYAFLEGARPPVYTQRETRHVTNVPSQVRSRSSIQADPMVDEEAGEKTVGIDDIPTELLRSIVLLAGNFSCDDPDLPELRSTQATIFACANVCRKWQYVSLSHKELWCRYLDFARYSVPRLHSLLLFTDPCPFNVGHRSAPLVLTWADQGRRDVFGIVRLIHQFRSRIRELHIEWGFGGSCILEDLWKMEASHLEVVTWLEFSNAHPSAPSAQTLRHFCSWLPELPFKRLDIHYTRMLPLDKPHGMVGLPSVNPKTTLPCDPFLDQDERPYTWVPAGSSIELPDLVLLTIGSLTSDEADHHIGLLVAIQPSPKCALQISELPYIHNSQCRAMLRSSIYKLMVQCDNPFELELVVDEEGVAMGNVKDPRRAFDWVRLGEQRVLALLQSSNVPLVTAQYHSSSLQDASSVFSQMISYFGEVTYSRVNSFRIALPPSFNIFPPSFKLEDQDWDFEDWEPKLPPHGEDFAAFLPGLLNHLQQVESIYANEEGACIVQSIIARKTR